MATPRRSGSGGASAKAGPVKFGMNEAKGSGPAYERLQAMADAYAKKSGATVSPNAVDHNTFQESINTYLQGTPDDVFTWFAGYRMSQFAENELISDISDVWPIDGLGDAFKKSATAGDGKQYFVPVSYYPWAVFYRKSVFEKNGWTEPKTLDELNALMKDMQGKKITPFAFAAKDAWAPMGTFDILNMRLNGYDFHMALTKGEKKWDSPEVKNVFATWKSLLPYHQENALGRTWQEAATSVEKQECGMYLLGTFVVDGVSKEAAEDMDFFTFPALDQTIGSDALDAPIDGFCVSAGGEDAGVGQGVHQVARQRRGRRRRQQRAPPRRSSRPTPVPARPSTARCRRSRSRSSRTRSRSRSSSTATPTPTSPTPSSPRRSRTSSRPPTRSTRSRRRSSSRPPPSSAPEPGSRRRT